MKKETAELENGHTRRDILQKAALATMIVLAPSASAQARKDRDPIVDEFVTEFSKTYQFAIPPVTRKLNLSDVVLQTQNRMFSLPDRGLSTWPTRVCALKDIQSVGEIPQHKTLQFYSAPNVIHREWPVSETHMRQIAGAMVAAKMPANRMFIMSDARDYAGSVFVTGKSGGQRIDVPYYFITSGALEKYQANGDWKALTVRMKSISKEPGVSLA